jgi:magnesium transporter
LGAFFALWGKGQRSYTAQDGVRLLIDTYMAHYRTQGSKPPGSSPGALAYIGEERANRVRITRSRFGASFAEEPQEIPVEDCTPGSDSEQVVWYTVDGVHDVELLQRLGDRFGIHPLVLEDIANTLQRPKLEEFNDYIFVALKMIGYDFSQEKLKTEHVSIILGKGYVLAFLEDPGDVFEPVRQRIRTGKGRIRRLGADYLAYALLDAIVDNYFQVLELLSEEIEELEEEVVDVPTSATLRAIHISKRQLIRLRRAVWPLREVVNALVRDELDLITQDTRLFLRDLYDHTIHVIDTVETLREMVAGMMEVYLSSVSNKLNQVMKVLTVISSIFIPLTFIVGVYGMNFDYMPELRWRWGYWAVWGVMLTVTAGLLGLFRHKKWM